MRIRLPIRELIRYSIALSVAITVFFFIMIYLQDMDPVSGLYRSVVSGAILLSTAVVSISLIVVFEKRTSTGSMERTRIRFILGALINSVLLFSYQFLRDFAEAYGFLPTELYDVQEMTALHGWPLYLVTFISSLMIYSLVHLLHNFILLQHLKTQAELEVSKLCTANAETTNRLLRQQVQPHFLFNALNVLKSLIKQNPKTAETYLLRLSDFLRTSFAQNEKGIASIKEELKICADYLEMQKIRFGAALEYSFGVPDQYLSCRLPFFSLQPLVENAIKHNELTDEKPLNIRIYLDRDLIKVENNLQRKSSVEGSTGNGLSNLSERYRLLSGDSIYIQDDGEHFCVGLKIL